MAQVLLLSEGFEDGFPQGWTAGDRDRAGVMAYWDAVPAEFGRVGAHTGMGKAYCAAVGYDGSGRLPAYRDSMAAFLRVIIDLSGYERATLRFWHWIAGIESGYDWAGVYVNGSVLWRSTDTTERWVQAEVDLTPFAGQTCELEFRFDSDASRTAEGWYLDDIEVAGVLGPLMPVMIHRGTNSDFYISWSGRGNLEQAPGVRGPWREIPDAVSPLGIAPVDAASFFRLSDGTQQSPNVVGYVNLTFQPGWNLWANPLDAGLGGNRVANLLPLMPEGAVLYVWRQGTYDLNAYAFQHWADPGMVLSWGEGVFLRLPAHAAPMTATLIGVVPQGQLSIPLTDSYNLIGSSVPERTDLEDPAVSFPAVDGDMVYTYGAGLGYRVYSFARQDTNDVGRWFPSSPQISPGEGFWVRRASGVMGVWTRGFAVPPPGAGRGLDGAEADGSAVRRAGLHQAGDPGLSTWATLNFCNRVPAAGVLAVVRKGDGTRLSGPGFVAQLLAGPAGGMIGPVSDPVPLANGSWAGFVYGGKVVVPGVAEGGTVDAQMVAWDGTGGLTFAQAMAAGRLVGHSARLSGVATGGDGLVVPRLPGDLIGLGDVVVAEVRYPLTLSVDPPGAGVVGALPEPGGEAGYLAGSEVQLTAVPSVGFEFLGWGGDVAVQGNPCVIVMDAPKNVIGRFGPRASCVICPGPMVLEAEPGECYRRRVTYEVRVDETWGRVTVTYNPPSGSTFPVGTTPVEVTATDATGFTSQCEFSVTIVEGATPGLAVERSRGQVVLSWPAAGSCFRLMSSPGLQPALWQPVAERIEVAGDRSVVKVAPAGESRYFVLRGGSRLVPSGLAASLGEAHTRSTGWEGPQARGEPVPVASGAGFPLAYIVPFRHHAEVFPETAALLETVAALKGRFGPLPEEGPENLPAEFFEALEDGLGPMSYVLVGADRENYPVLLAQNCLHPYYLNQDSARRRAQTYCGGADVVLEGYAMPGPQDEYFVFRSGARWLLVHARSLRVIESEEFMALPRYGVPAELAADRDQAWAVVGMGGGLHSGPEAKWIHDYSLIPIVDWTYWCVPTAYTMVMGFYDHYEAGLKIPGYGRLVDFWYENGTGHNVPNFLDELIDPTLTPPNWRPAGLLAILNNPEWNGYAFQRTDVKGNPGNDWAWAGLRSELDAERPTVWSDRPEDLKQVGHAMAAFGYRVSGSQRFVIVYNTWGTTRQQQYAEYNYNQWIEGGASGGTGYAQILPGGGSGSEDGIVLSPRGGDVVFGPSQIQWQVVGNSIKYTQLYDSVDAGRTWVFRSVVAIPAPGVYSQPWTPPSSTSRGRVRIRCLDAAWNLVAGDGSVANVYFQALPELEPVAGPTGFCNLRDGKLVVLVSNAGTVAATPTTTEVAFQCLGGPQAVRVPTPAIPAKGMVEVLFDIPGACWNLDCRFEIRVDVLNQVKEANEGNNAVTGVCAG